MKNNVLKCHGPWEVSRRFVFPAMSSAGDSESVRQAMDRLAGVRGAVFNLDWRTVTICYDTTETDYAAILEAADQAGYPPAAGWMAKIKRNWLQNMDLTSRENAGIKVSACCNKPPQGNG